MVHNIYKPAHFIKTQVAWLAISSMLICTRCTTDKCSSQQIAFAGLNLIFPSSVGEAVKKNKMQFRPPGHYYKELTKDQLELVFMYDYELSDFDNENQPKETLYHRMINAYMFRFKERKGLEDSLKNSLERAYGKKFTSIQTGSVPRTAFSRIYHMHFLDVSPCLTIGLSSSPIDIKNNRKVVVRFLYNLTNEERIVQMRGYL